ncbi:hypothetical protein [Brachybacterium squillarum]|nr:hypothetical protein [Brachybacterium squillarum]
MSRAKRCLPMSRVRYPSVATCSTSIRARTRFSHPAPFRVAYRRARG